MFFLRMPEGIHLWTYLSRRSIGRMAVTV